MTINQLIADIRATFPGVRTMLRECCMSGKQMWMIGAEDSAQMPDGLPIFSQWLNGEDSHDGGVHCAFTTWIENRGWYLENEDGFWHVPTIIPTAEEIAEWHAAYAIASAKRSAKTGVRPDDDGLPF